MKTFLKIIIALFLVIAVAAGIAALFNVELPKFDIKNPFSTETETETSTDADETPSDTSSSGDSTSTDTGAASCDHDYETVIVNATCTESGSTTLTCKLCGKKSVIDVDALGHSYEGGLCTRCGASDSTVDPATCEHEFVSAGSEHSCCSKCGSGLIGSGTWAANSTIELPSEHVIYNFAFTSSGNNYSQIMFNYDGNEGIYYHNGGDELYPVYSSGNWVDTSFEYITVDSDTVVSPEFYVWFIANFSHTGEG